MPMTEKEYNGNLCDQLSLLEEIEEVVEQITVEDDKQKILKIINKKRKQIERKLYQKPPISGQ